MKPYLYFDHAATSYPKPNCVLQAMMRALKERGGNPGRSSHGLSLAAAEGIFDCREEICSLFSYAKPERVIFTQNTTYALNLAIQGLAKPNSHIVLSNLEHNSVIRPVYALAMDPNKKISFSYFDAQDADDDQVVEHFEHALRENTAMAVVTLASNICGRILPIKRIGEICEERGILLIGDAAQAAGIIPIHFAEMHFDALCLAGHKGLYGPQGTGALLLSDRATPHSIIQGGNGVASLQPEMSGELPEYLEAGTLNTPGICGLCAGIQYVKAIGISEIFEREQRLTRKLTDGLRAMPDVTIYGDYSVKTPVILFNKQSIPSEEAAQALSDQGICVRSGFHCAPKAHEALKTGPDGAVRASLGIENTDDEIEIFLNAVSKLRK